MNPEMDLQPMHLNQASKLAMLAVVCLFAQGLFWYFSSPGPQLAGETGLFLAGVRCLLALVTLMALPLAWSLATCRSFEAPFLGMGDRSFGVRGVILLTPAFVIGTLMGSSDEQIIAYYPMPGDQIGSDLMQMLVWFTFYLFYYVAFEFFYRGVMLHGFQSFGMIAAIALQTACCLVVHLGKPTIEVWGSIPASIVLGWLAWRTRSIWYGVAIHYLVGIANDLGALWQGNDLGWP